MEDSKWLFIFLMVSVIAFFSCLGVIDYSSGQQAIAEA